MSNTDNKAICTIHSPFTGVVKDLEEVPDPAFARKMIGDGVAVEPTVPFVFAPEDGTVISVFETKHAIVFQTDEGRKLLIHTGVGTMKLQGEGFNSLVDDGEKVKKGDKLMNIDIEHIRSHSEALISPVIFLDLDTKNVVNILASGHIEAGEPLMELLQD